MQQVDEQNRVLERWLDAYRGLLFKIVRAYAFTPTDREDLFQEIALQVWRSIPGFRGDSAAKTWVYRVAVNTAVAWTRREIKHRRGQPLLSDIEPVLSQIDTHRNHQSEWLYERIGQLNEIDRSLTLMFLDGFTYDEIATTLGISESNVGAKIHRLKSHLARLLQRENIHGD